MEEYCEHIPSEVKKIQQRITQQKLEEKLTEDDKVGTASATFLLRDRAHSSLSIKEGNI